MLIKCPECGHQVSEKAPVCPTCGVEIAGKIIRCQNCGEVYFTDEGVCPACHQAAAPYATPRRTPPANTTPRPQQSPAAPLQTSNPQKPETPETPEKKKNRWTLPLCIVFAAIICGVLFHMYSKVQGEKETEDYEFAMRSTDPEVLQSYLTRYPDAPAEHRDSVEAHILLLQKGDEEWQNAVLSNSRAALQRFVDNNPNSVHRQEALNKIDSLDWVAVQNSSNIADVEAYAKAHPDGRYIDEATILISKIKSNTVQPDEKIMVTSLFRQFFQSINSKDENRLTATVAMVMDTFLGKTNATSGDVLTFLHKIYKDDIQNMNWHIDSSSYKIDKKEIAEDEYEYDVTFNASQIIERNGESEEVKYRINATVTNEGKISGFNLTRLQ